MVRRHGQGVHEDLARGKASSDGVCCEDGCRRRHNSLISTTAGRTSLFEARDVNKYGGANHPHVNKHGGAHHRHVNKHGVTPNLSQW